MNIYQLKLILSTVLFLSFAIQLNAQAPNEVDDQGRKQGKWTKFDASGNMVYRATFKDDKPVGEMTRFYEDGSKQAVLNFVTPTKAKAKLYYPDKGGLMAEGNYLNQERDSVWLFYNPTGELASRETFSNGIRQGEAIVYFQDGSIAEKSTYEDGVQNGKWLQFFENGNLKLEATVVDGVSYEGEYVSYYPKGTKMLKGKYQDGKKESSWYHFNEDGSIEIIYVYRYGKVISEHRKNGTFDEYYPDDIKKSSVTFKDGKKNGPFVEYYHQGEWVESESLDEYGNPRKVQKLEGIQVEREGTYKDDVLHGEVKYYKENGRLDRIERYDMGELID